MKKLNTKEYIRRAKEVHGDKYDYSETSYKSSRDPVKIICKEHGPFLKNSKSHLYGYACNYCSGKELTFADFVERSNKIHENKYLYIEESFKGVNYPISIICFDHGEFHQHAMSHLSGCGCPKCSKSYPLTNSRFINRVKRKFGDRFDCNQVSYTNKYTKVTLICKKHGPFEIVPNNISRTEEPCPICSGIRCDTPTFIEKARKVHGKSYKYNNVQYIDAETSIIIICPKHGSFNQTPHSHLSGAGCPYCSETRGERRVSRILEKIGVKYKREVKFNGCEYKKPLRFDFFIEEKNTCIEYDGILHYKYVPGVHSTYDNFVESSARDIIKDIYCVNSGINLIRIPYYTKSADIKDILSNALK